MALVKRGGRVRSFRVANVTAHTLKGAVRAHVDTSARLMTDGNPSYRGLDKEYAHESVNHEAHEYVRDLAHTNTVESYFSILKRGIEGVYHHVSPVHLPRYLGDDLTDGQRAVLAVKGAEGKRLTYKPLVGRNQNGVTL